MAHRRRNSSGAFGALCALLLSAPALVSCAQHGAGAVTVLDDFESADSLGLWRGQVALTEELASHGHRSLKATLFPDDVVSEKLPKDWRGYGRLLLDIYNAEASSILVGLRLYDELADDVEAEARSESYLADQKLLLISGWNHIEVRLDGLEVSSASRALALDKVRRLTITSNGLNHPVTIYIDNLRLARGDETTATASRQRPEDGTVSLAGRFVTLDQVGPR